MTELAPVTQSGQHFGKQVLREARHRPLACCAAIFLVALVVSCAFAGLVAPYGPEAEDLFHILNGPSAAHLLGTDELGRDVLSRLLYGGRVSLLAAGESVLTFTVVGLPIGLISGYVGGGLDRGIMWVADIVLSLPTIIILLVVAAVLHGDAPLMISLGVIASPVLIRVTRSATLSVRQELYVKAAEILGLPRRQVLRNHVLPRVLPTVLVQLTVFASAAVVIESALGFLGLDATPPAPSWGSMVAEAATVIDQSQWMIVTTGLTIALTALSLGLVGDAIREVSTGQSLAKPKARDRARNPLNVTAPRSGQGAGKVRHDLEIAGARAGADAEIPFPERDDVLLSVKDLAVSVRTAVGELSLVDRVTFDVQRGECLGVVGESGCGKTMMALAILGLLPDGCRISGGRVWFDGTDVSSLPKKARKDLRGRGIGFISQEPMQALDPGVTIGSELREVIRRNRHMTRRAARKEAIRLLEQVRIPNPDAVARQYPHELSGGMAQRVCIALALTGQPKLLIADEPTTALDVTVQAEVLDLLSTLRAETDMAVLLISHDWGVIADSCDNATVMYAGEVAEWGSVPDILGHPLHPYTEALLAANPHLISTGPLTTIPGSVPPPGQWPEGCRFAARCAYRGEDCTIAAVEARSVGPQRATRCLYPERVGTSREPVDV